MFTSLFASRAHTNRRVRSLIASYLGNIVGGLIVGLPATYFYLSDYRADGLRGVEEGEAFNGDTSNVTADAESSKGSNGNLKANEETYEVAHAQ